MIIYAISHSIALSQHLFHKEALTMCSGLQWKGLDTQNERRSSTGIKTEPTANPFFKFFRNLVWFYLVCDLFSPHSLDLFSKCTVKKKTKGDFKSTQTQYLIVVELIDNILNVEIVKAVYVVFPSVSARGRYYIRNKALKLSSWKQLKSRKEKSIKKK